MLVLGEKVLQCCSAAVKIRIVKCLNYILYLYIYFYIYKYRDIFEGVKSLLRTAALQQLQQIGKILLQN